MCGSVVVTFRGSQRRRAGGVLGEVYERSGLFVCVCLSLVNVASARVLRDSRRKGVLSSSSLDASHCVELCVARSLVSQRHCTPRCTLADLLEAGSRNGDNRPGGLQKGEVGRRTLTSHVAKNPLGGRVLLGGERSSGVSLHGGGPDVSSLAAGVAVFCVRGGSLAIRS